MDTIEFAQRLYNKAKKDHKICIDPHENKSYPNKLEGIIEGILDEYDEDIHNELNNLKSLDSLIADLYSVVSQDLKAAANNK